MPTIPIPPWDVAIEVYPPSLIDANSAFWKAMADLEPVSFRAAEIESKDPAIPLILLDVSISDALVAAKYRRQVFALIKDSPEIFDGCDPTVSFALSKQISSVLRGQKLSDSRYNRAFPALPEGAEILARKGSDPIWVRCLLNDSEVHLVPGPILKFVEGTFLFEHFRDGDFMELLPLIHFLRSVAGGFNSEEATRACFMFDDPNLHWPSFGYVQYESIVKSAVSNNYHVSFATIPLDGFYVNRFTAEFFKKHPGHISLLVHGNDHVKDELGRERDQVNSVQIAAQALRRSDSIQKKADVLISRIMAAPHGACVESMADAMLAVGFDAACISRGSMMFHNPSKIWPQSVGLNPGEFLGTGFPIIPRDRLLSANNTKIVLAAFLRKPLILVGHHNDLRFGLSVLEDLAQKINQIGQVKWMNISEIYNTQYSSYKLGNVLLLVIYSRDVRIALEADVKHVLIRRAWMRSAEAKSRIHISAGHKTLFDSVEGQTAIVDVDGVNSIFISSDFENRLDYTKIAAPPVRLWPFARRILAESRDRIISLTGR